MRGTIILIAVAASMLSTSVSASGLIPVRSMLPEGKSFTNIAYWNRLGYEFDCKVSVSENAKAAFYSEERMLTTASPVVSPKDNTADRVMFNMDDKLFLPKGKVYRLVVPAGIVRKTDDPLVTNDELVYTFNISDTVIYNNSNFAAGMPDGLECSSGIGFLFETETEGFDGARLILQRNGITIRTEECHVSWDWNRGNVWMEFTDYNEFFGEDDLVDAHFEKGVEYTLILPENSIYDQYRTDITNDRITHTFTGGWSGQADPLHFSGCSLDDDRPIGTLGKVQFYYDRPVVSTTAAILSLTSSDAGDKPLEASATIHEETGRWILEADFGDVALSEGKEYTITIPEASIVNKKGDITVNKTESYGIKNRHHAPASIPAVRINGQNAIPTAGTDDVLKTIELSSDDHEGGIPQQAYGYSFTPDGLESAWSIGFRLTHTLAPCENPQMILERNGVVIRTADCNLKHTFSLYAEDSPQTTDVTMRFPGMDYCWGMYGAAQAHFEDGVEYRLILPQHSVQIEDNPSLTNDRITHSFTGGWTGQPDPLHFSGCSLDGSNSISSLGKVRFYYDRPVVGTSAAILSLSSSNAYAEPLNVPGTVREENGTWVLEADFGDVALSEDDEYTITIPEAAVTYKEGDIVVNKAEEYKINVVNGMAEIATDAGTGCTKWFDLQGNAVRADGLAPGVYIRMTGNKSTKVILR